MQAVQRAGVARHGGQRERRGVADLFDVDQRAACHRSALRVPIPFDEAAQRSDDQTCVRRRVFEIECAPVLRGARDRVAWRVGADGQAEEAQHAVAVMREVRVQPHPAIGSFDPAAVKPGELVPHLGRAAVDAEAAKAFERRVAHVHAHLLAQSIALVTDFGGNQGRRAERGLRCSAHGERARQHRVAASQHQVLQRPAGQPGRLPDRFQCAHGVRHHGECSGRVSPSLSANWHRPDTPPSPPDRRAIWRRGRAPRCGRFRARSRSRPHPAPPQQTARPAASSRPRS